jgi:hypothetical protein
MSNLSKIIDHATGGLLPEVKLDPRHPEQVLGLLTHIAPDLKNQAADYLIGQSGVDITDLLNRLPPNQKIKVMAWAMKQGSK